MNSFEQLGLAPALLKALAGEGYDHPTPIQIQAIPPVMEGRDLVGLAQTGTGKTAAFALPILHRLSKDRRHAGARACRVLVLAPTRELAAQIADSFRAYGKFIGLSTAVVFGGVPIGKQFRALERGVDILVATPGRLLDLISQRACRLDSVEVLVLDEADHMMDLGFIVPLKRIARMLPPERQTLFFSATMPPEIEDLSRDFIHEPVRVAVAPVSSTAERVSQAVIHVEHAKKQALLHDLLKDQTIKRALVFSRTKHGANRILEKLVEAGFSADAIHGNKSQGQRVRALEAFKKGHARLLIATEIAARGIDVDGVSHVINFDLPDVPEQYVHRIGRTARAGADGAAISFCAPDERINLRDIERLTKKPVPVTPHPMGLAAPQPGERLQKRPPRQQQRQQRPMHGKPQRKPSHVHEQHDAQPRGEGRRKESKTQHAPRKASHAHDHYSAPKRKEGPRQDWQRQDGPRKDGPRKDGPRKEGQRQEGQRHDGPRKEGRSFDAGDRRDRKGNEVWSNAPAPFKRNANRTRRPQRG